MSYCSLHSRVKLSRKLFYFLLLRELNFERQRRRCAKFSPLFSFQQNLILYIFDNTVYYFFFCLFGENESRIKITFHVSQLKIPARSTCSTMKYWYPHNTTCLISSLEQCEKNCFSLFRIPREKYY